MDSGVKVKMKKIAVLFVIVLFSGCSTFSQTNSEKSDNQSKKSASDKKGDSVAVKDLKNISGLITEANVGKTNLKLENCRLTRTINGKSSSFDFPFAGTCQFEKDPDDNSKARIVKTRNGKVLLVLGIEKLENNTSADVHEQPCNTSMRWVIIKNDKIFLSNKTDKRKSRCVYELDEKDYFIFSSPSQTFEQAEKN